MISSPILRIFCGRPLRFLYAVIVPSLLALTSASGVELLVYNNSDANSSGSLRQAINDNNALGGGNTIVFSNTVTGTILLTNSAGQLAITKDLTIVGPGANVLAISGNNAHRVFYITNCTASISGLAIINGKTNSASIADGGGGIFNASSTLTLSNCTVTGNSAGVGGGIMNVGTLTLISSTLNENSATNRGGALCNFAQSISTVARIVTSTIVSNTAATNSGGGAIWNEGGPGNVVATLTISASTFSDNSARYGGTIANVAYSDIQIGDTILRAGSSGNVFYKGGPSNIISRGYNLCSDNGGGFMTGVADQINIDPLLGPLQDNGGPTPTMLPLPGSTAIDQGKRDAIAALATDTDQRGFPRLYTNAIPAATLGDHSDIGAVEVSPIPLVVSNLNDSGSGSLREAIAQAIPVERDLITFAPNVSGTIVLTSGELFTYRSMTIAGPGKGKLAISGNHSSRVFAISNASLTLTGLTITNGYATNAGGGGILIDGVSLAASECAIVGNTADHPYGGGAMAVYGGSVTLSNCAVLANTATSFSQAIGGGIRSQGLLTLRNTTIANNRAIAGDPGFVALGGGVCNDYTGRVTAVTCTIASNSASGSSYGSGGGVVGPQVALTNCTIVGNLATAYGGGLYVGSAGSFVVAGCIVADNSAGTFGPDVFGTYYTSGGFNLIGKTNTSTGFGVNQDQTGSAASPLEPLVRPLGYYGGLSPTMPLLSGSPAIDKGKSYGLATDQRGAPRPFDFSSITNVPGGDGSDIGAVEKGSSLLGIERASSSVVLFWPAYYGDLSLEFTTNLLSSSSWSDLVATPVTLGNQLRVTNSVTSGSKLYRLKGL